jgi:hypothetical protein
VSRACCGGNTGRAARGRGCQRMGGSARRGVARRGGSRRRSARPSDLALRHQLIVDQDPRESPLHRNAVRAARARHHATGRGRWAGEGLDAVSRLEYHGSAGPRWQAAQGHDPALPRSHHPARHPAHQRPAHGNQLRCTRDAGRRRAAWAIPQRQGDPGHRRGDSKLREDLLHERVLLLGEPLQLGLGSRHSELCVDCRGLGRCSLLLALLLTLRQRGPARLCCCGVTRGPGGTQRRRTP